MVSLDFPVDKKLIYLERVIGYILRRFPDGKTNRK